MRKATKKIIKIARS